MKISQSLKEFMFHDATVTSISYFYEQRIVSIKIVFDEDEAVNGLKGSLIFYNVEDFVSNPPLESISWNGERYADVMAFNYYPEKDRGLLEGLEASMELRYYKHQGWPSQALVIKFLSAYFDWEIENK